MTAIRLSRPARRAAGLFAAAALAVGCGGGRKPCYPVSGTVLVDGKAAPDCLVRFDSHDPADHDGPNRVFPLAMADEKGRFQLSTYGANDGAPAGEYVVLIQWLVAEAGDEESSVDRLGNRYTDPETSKIRIRVSEGENVLERIHLK